MKCLDNVIYIDNHLMVVDKPAGIATQPDLVDLAKAWIKKKYQKPGNVFLHAVHRLDQPVSGLVLLARTSKALSRLQAMMREHQIEKIYEAWVAGSLPDTEGTLVHHLEKGSFRTRVSQKGKESMLEYRVLETSKGISRVEIRLVTGRYHQIRAQLAAVGCPILGDVKYGSKKPWRQGIALHHREMRLQHPVTQEKLSFISQRRLDS